MTAPSPSASLVRRLPFAPDQTREIVPLLEREWLVTNGLGGYASGTLSGAATRRYHGLLIAALPAPIGRVMMLSHLTETFRFADWSNVRVGGSEKAGGTLDVHGVDAFSEFRLESGLPVWQFRMPGHLIEKRLFMPYRRNTVHVSYRMLEGGGAVRLKLRPSVHFRGHDDPVGELSQMPYTLTAVEGRYELAANNGLPPLRLHMTGEKAQFSLDGVREPDILYRTEENRGYESVGALWSPGFFRVWLHPGQEVTLTASTERWERMLALAPGEALAAELSRRAKLLHHAAPAARGGTAAELVLAADQFIIKPAGRVEDSDRAQASGDEARTVIAGYHWFTDWGRDTMISFEGLTLATGRYDEAGYILRTFANYIRDGLLPNFFPDGEKEGLYHTADATLWYFHALQRYVNATEDRGTLDAIIPKLLDIVAHHMRGTRFGIGVDPRDGLLRQGAEGYQLTWMDAKVGDWVVTPRRGKAVEINALWYNALRLLAGWVGERGDAAAAADLGRAADQAQRSFNQRFWYAQGGYLYDVVDGEQGDDASLRPNQIFALSLDHPILDPARWPAVVSVVERELLTPVGLRTLARQHPDYKEKYYGDLRARDAAYHQGTVWAWLIGPFVDAWLRVHEGDRAAARRLLAGFEHHLSEACVGSISEVFDAEEPYTHRACIAQAWSVAEVLRCLVKTANPE